MTFRRFFVAAVVLLASCAAMATIPAKASPTAQDALDSALNDVCLPYVQRGDSGEALQVSALIRTLDASARERMKDLSSGLLDLQNDAVSIGAANLSGRNAILVSKGPAFSDVPACLIRFVGADAKRISDHWIDRISGTTGQWRFDPAFSSPDPFSYALLQNQPQSGGRRARIEIEVVRVSRQSVEVRALVLKAHSDDRRDLTRAGQLARISEREVRHAQRLSDVQKVITFVDRVAIPAVQKQNMSPLLWRKFQLLNSAGAEKWEANEFVVLDPRSIIFVLSEHAEKHIETISLPLQVNVLPVSFMQPAEGQISRLFQQVSQTLAKQDWLEAPPLQPERGTRTHCFDHRIRDARVYFTLAHPYVTLSIAVDRLSEGSHDQTQQN